MTIKIILSVRQKCQNGGRIRIRLRQINQGLDEMQQAVHGWLSTYERLVNSQYFFSSYLTQEDMSRFGRDYLKVGFYTDVMFRDKGVRFIAVNNGIDSDKQGDNDFTPFLNIMNEFYARDSSRKIQAIFKARMQDGKRVSPSVPYGYRRDPQDKQHLIVDEEAAAVVRRIFQMVIEGYGVKGIADALTADKVLIPSAYAKLHNPENDHSKGFHDPCLWSSTAVGYILEKQEYMGHTVLGKTICENYKTKKRRKAKPEELMIFRDTHEAIVDEETWQLAHRLKKTIRKPSYPDRPANPLTGLLYCADCGHKLTHHQPSPSKKKVYDADDYYICGNYRQLTRDCTIHYIKTSAIEKLILTAIREVSAYVREDEKQFIHIVRDAASAGQEQTAREQKKRLRQVEKRIAELDELIRKLYEGNATGKIPDKHFNRLLVEYDTEQSALEQEAAELKEGITAQAEDGMRAQRFVSLVRRYDKIPRPEAGAFDNRSAASDSKGALRADPSWDRRSNGACLPCKFRRPEKMPEAALPQSPFDRARPDPDGYIPAAQRKSPVRCCSFCTQPVEISQEALCDRVFLPQIQLADHIVLALV